MHCRSASAAYQPGLVGLRRLNARGKGHADWLVGRANRIALSRCEVFSHSLALAVNHVFVIKAGINEIRRLGCDCYRSVPLTGFENMPFEGSCNTHPLDNSMHRF